MSEELKPCPFCGHALIARWTGANPKASCRTEDCWGAKLPTICLDVPEQIAAWNRRAAPQPAPAAVPAGHALVPLKLTEAMHVAGVRTIVRCNGNDDWPPRVWAAMLAAAPAPATGGEHE